MVAIADQQTPDSSATSSQWQAIADLKIKLRSNVAFFQHEYRKKIWHVALDTTSGKQFLCSDDIKHLLEQLDGHRTLEQVHTAICQNSEACQPSYDDITLILLKLAQADMLQGDIMMDDKQRASKQRQHQRMAGWRRFTKPFAIRIPLLDPDKYLHKLLPACQLLFTRPAFIIWTIWISWAFFTSLSLWPELKDHWNTRFLDPTNLLWLWLLYPAVKGLHELGHALTTKFWGGQVHEAGIMLLVFIPMPYVDASASATFCNKHQRILVAAMGVMVELFLAASGIYIWQALETGLTKDLAFNIAAIASFSTLLFNGNPLLRFDGYYVLSDAIEIPNLSTRSSQYLGYLIKRYIFNFHSVQKPSLSTGERRWLVSYGLLSGCYRIFIALSIAFYIAGKFFIIGLLLACWAIYSQIIQPLYHALKQLFLQAKIHSQQPRVFSVITAILIFGYGLFFVLPITSSSYAKGIIMLPEYAYIRAQSDGFIQQVYPKDGQAVNPGDKLIALENNQLPLQMQENQAKQIEANAHYHHALKETPLTAGLFKNELLALKAEQLEFQEQLDNLQLTSNSHGIFSSANPEDLPGRFVKKGDLVAHVVDFKDINARVVVTQSVVDQVRRNTQAIEIRLSSNPATTINASNANEIPSATHLLPSKLLGSQAGGHIPVDASDQAGTRAIRQFFQFDVPLPASADNIYPGQRVIVRFIHSQETLAKRWYRQLGQLLITFMVSQ